MYAILLRRIITYLKYLTQELQMIRLLIHGDKGTGFQYLPLKIPHKVYKIYTIT